MDTDVGLVLETVQDVLEFHAERGGLISFRRMLAPDQEFIAQGMRTPTPAFVIQYLDEGADFREVSSLQAAEVGVRVLSPHLEAPGSGTTLEARFVGLAGLDLDARVTVSASSDDRFSRWRITVTNRAGIRITSVQFPFLVVPYALDGEPGSEALLWPYGAGKLIRSPRPQDLEPDSPHAWQMVPENGTSVHYPGWTVAQFMAYYNDRAGIYVACQDAAGLIKLIKPVHREPGLRLGVAHVGDWPRHGKRELEYDVVVGSFTGDWYAAADMYRDWTRSQSWTRRPLIDRDDVPDWLLDSPPHIILRMQGELDAGPAEPNSQFLPYPKMIPLLDDIAERVDAPLVGVIMSWERPGPWIYPDCFPPAGGFDSLKEFTDLARQRGWRVGTFCNGTRWVVEHRWSGYDGREYFAEHNGPETVTRTPDGSLWFRPSGWRSDYPGCLGVDQTREMATDFVRTMVDTGLDWVQFLDQNVGCCTFPCYAADHDHPPYPGRWMTDAMQRLADDFAEIGAETEADSGGKRRLAFAVEGPVNEFFIPNFQICDIRVVPPGHAFPAHPYWRDFVPLYHYLYHEFILIQGGFGQGPEPHHMTTRNAANLVFGEIPGAVMRGDGQLLNLDTINWAPWDIDVGDNDDSLQMLASTTALRRGPARDFLVFGRMLAPTRVEGVKTVRWDHDSRHHQIPAVFHSAWQTPDGSFGVVLANWTTELQKVTVVDERLAGRVRLTIADRHTVSTDHDVGSGGLRIRLPPLSCALVTAI
jgi:hypothetical protein